MLFSKDTSTVYAFLLTMQCTESLIKMHIQKDLQWWPTFSQKLLSEKEYPYNPIFIIIMWLDIIFFFLQVKGFLLLWSETYDFSLTLQCNSQSWSFVWVSRNPGWSHFYLSQKTVYITFIADCCDLNFFFDWQFIFHHSVGYHFDFSLY